MLDLLQNIIVTTSTYFVGGVAIYGTARLIFTAWFISKDACNHGHD